MCGICGVISLSGRAVDDRPVRAMLAAMTHRGPDSEGVLAAPGLAAGIRRLAVIDVHGGDQPVSNEDGRVSVVFNGEIYNFRELREELERDGHAFRTRSDTEVLVHLWERDGPALVERLDGMFALCLHDRASGTTFLARDRLGIKPLFVATEGDMLAFASETRVLLAHPGVPRTIDRGALAELFVFQHVDGGRTIRARIRELEPGHALTVRGGRVDERRWYTPPVPAPVTGASLEERGAELRELVERSVLRRTVADVPLGVFLSGGLDSTIVTSILARSASPPLRTFSIGFDGPASHDESRHARLVSRHFDTEHHALRVVADDVARLLPVAIRHLAEPVADPALLPTWVLSEHARREVTVVLTGEGADELFGGYRRYALQERLSALARLPGFARVARSALARRLPGRAPQALTALAEADPARRHAVWAAVVAPSLLRSLFGEPEAERLARDAAERARTRLADAPDPASLGARLRADLLGWLPGMLLAKVDRASMAHSLEARVPFLSHELVAWAAGVPDAMKIGGGTTKRVLREAFRADVPAEIGARRKQGFDLPLDAWLRGPLRDHAERAFVPRVLALWPELDAAAATKMLRAHLGGRARLGLPLFLLLSSLLFLEQEE